MFRRIKRAYYNAVFIAKINSYVNFLIKLYIEFQYLSDKAVYIEGNYNFSLTCVHHLKNIFIKSSAN